MEILEAMKNDGWILKDENSGFFRLSHPEGFAAHLSRGAEYPHAVWGPDELAVESIAPYSMQTLRENVNKCCNCKQMVSKTVRVGFAGRVCVPCRPEVAKEVEYPGWTN